MPTSRLRRLALLLAGVICALSVAALDGVKRLQFVADADKAIAEERWNDAADLIMSALKEEPANPSNALLVSNLGIVRFNQGQDSLALVTLDEAHDMAPNSVTILSNRARVRTALGKVNGAIADLRRVCELDSTLSQPLFTLGMLLLRTEQAEAADSVALRLKKLVPNTADTHVLFGSIAMNKHNWKEAVKQFALAVRTDPCAEYYMSLAWAALHDDDLAQASEAITEGLRLDPLSTDLLLARIILCRKQYRPNDAQTAANQAVLAGAAPAEVRLYLQGPLSQFGF